MIAVKGKYDGMTVTFDRIPAIHECEVIITFLDPLDSVEDDGIREPIVDFGKAVGNEQW